MKVDAAREVWPVRGHFSISRGSRSEAVVVVAELEAGRHRGRGECTPYPRYGESVDQVMEDVRRAGRALADGDGRDRLWELLPPGAARNALDAAHWDLEASRSGVSVRWRLGRAAPAAISTFVTVGVGTPEEMREAARDLAPHALRIKVKGKGSGDVERVAAIREALPDCRMILDANEAWSFEQLERFLPELRRLGVELVEQPLPAGDDEALAGYRPVLPLCADESCHDRSSLGALTSKYQYVNIKLDKAGGLTEGLALLREAREKKLGVMVGCMLGTSLAMAPALLLAEEADLVDLDAPLLLARDRQPGLTYREGKILPAPPGLWGTGAEARSETPPRA